VVKDIYEELRQKSLREFEEIDQSDIVNRSLEFALSNNSKKTDYASWSAGSKKFADDNYEALTKWVN